MTRRTLLTTSVMVLLSITLILPESIEAQTGDSRLQNIRASIIQAIGAEASTVEVSITGNVFSVMRVNSNMNSASHGARDGEAARIAPVVAKAFADKPDFGNIHTIRVVYLDRSKPSGAPKVIDRVDFRKDPSGVFVFHTT